MKSFALGRASNIVAANPEIAERLCSAMDYLRIAGEEYRLRNAKWGNLEATVP